MGYVDPNKVILKEKVLRASSTEVWKLLSTRKGLESFFAPKCEIELCPLGNFEIHFFPDNPPGTRGAENLNVLSLIPGRMLSFTWDAPPLWPEIRKERTYVVIEVQSVDQKSSLLRFSHWGWGEGDDWEAVYDYFQKAWDVVLERLDTRLREGPIDWSKAR